MREPQRVTIDSPQEKHANIKQSLFWADNAAHKRKLLDHWLRDTSINQAIVFASTQVECDGLANDLQQDGFSAVALHGALSQGLRNRRLMALRQGQVQILVATDVAARGIDVPTITHVFNFGLPMKAEDYTHRIGRTGRACRDGLAITFAEFRDRRRIMDIEQYSRQQFKAEVIPGMRTAAAHAAIASRRASFGGRGRGGDRRRGQRRRWLPRRQWRRQRLRQCQRLQRPQHARSRPGAERPRGGGFQGGGQGTPVSAAAATVTSRPASAASRAGATAHRAAMPAAAATRGWRRSGGPRSEGGLRARNDGFRARAMARPRRRPRQGVLCRATRRSVRSSPAR